MPFKWPEALLWLVSNRLPYTLRLPCLRLPPFYGRHYFWGPETKRCSNSWWAPTVRNIAVVLQLDIQNNFNEANASDHVTKSVHRVKNYVEIMFSFLLLTRLPSNQNFGRTCELWSHCSGFTHTGRVVQTGCRAFHCSPFRDTAQWPSLIYLLNVKADTL